MLSKQLNMSYCRWPSSSLCGPLHGTGLCVYTAPPWPSCSCCFNMMTERKSTDGANKRLHRCFCFNINIGKRFPSQSVISKCMKKHVWNRTQDFPAAQKEIFVKPRWHEFHPLEPMPSLRGHTPAHTHQASVSTCTLTALYSTLANLQQHAYPSTWDRPQQHV